MWLAWHQVSGWACFCSQGGVPLLKGVPTWVVGRAGVIDECVWSGAKSQGVGLLLLAGRRAELPVSPRGCACLISNLGSDEAGFSEGFGEAARLRLCSFWGEVARCARVCPADDLATERE